MALQVFQVHFENPVQDSGDALTNVVFLSEEPTADDVLVAVLSLLAGSDVGIQLKPTSNKKASPDHHHFRLTFKPGALARPEAITLAEDHAALWDMAHVQETRAGAGAGAARAVGEHHLYLLYKGTTELSVGKDSPLRLMLSKVGAAVKGGTRGTRAELTLTHRITLVEIGKLPEEEYNLSEYTSLSLIARRTEGGGKSTATLSAGFVTSDVVLNNGSTKSYLVLQIVNTGPLPIALSTDPASPSKLSLVFTPGDATTALSALGTVAQVRGMHIPGKADSSGTDPTWSGKDDWTIAPQTNGKTWVLTPRAGKKEIAPDEAIEIPISNVVTSHVTGRSPLRIHHGGLPAHHDGELTVYIQKYPLVYADTRAATSPSLMDLRVGIGTTSPIDRLTVDTGSTGGGITVKGETITLATHLTGSGTAARAGVGTRSNHQLFFYTNNRDAGPAMTVATNGMIGVGTNDPKAPLHVQTGTGAHGLRHTDNVVGIGTRVDTAGGAVGTTTNHPLRFFTNSGTTAQVTLLANGNLGVGTDNPTHKLTVHAAGTGITHSDGPRQLSTKLDGRGAAIGTVSLHPLRLETADKPRMTLTSDGKVGIGTEAPSADFHVTGSAQLDGNIRTPRTFVFQSTEKPNHDEDLARFLTENGKATFVLKHDGRLGLGTSDPKGMLDVAGNLMIRGQKPIAAFSATVKWNAPAKLTYTTKDWLVVVTGFSCEFGSGQTIAGIKCYADGQGATWNLCTDVTNVDRSWRVHAIAIRRELVEGSYTY